MVVCMRKTGRGQRYRRFGDRGRASDHRHVSARPLGERIEAWKRSEFKQRQCCEAERIPLKAFGNWRTLFKAEP